MQKSFLASEHILIPFHRNNFLKILVPDIDLLLLTTRPYKIPLNRRCAVWRLAACAAYSSPGAHNLAVGLNKEFDHSIPKHVFSSFWACL